MGFDLSSIRRPSTYEQEPAVKKLITTIPIEKKPDKRDFFRVRPDEKDQKWSIPVYILETKTNVYLVDNSAYDVANETGCMKAVDLFYLLNLNETEPYISWIPWPDSDGTDNDYNRTRREAFKLSNKDWIKIKANKKQGLYEVNEAISKFPDPQWPEEPSTMEKAVEIAFRDYFIDSPDHPVLKDLRGEQ